MKFMELEQLNPTDANYQEKASAIIEELKALREQQQTAETYLLSLEQQLSEYEQRIATFLTHEDIIVTTEDNQPGQMTLLAGENISFTQDNNDGAQTIGIDLTGVIGMEHMLEEVKNENLLIDNKEIKQELLPENIKNILCVYFKTENNVTDYSIAYLDNAYLEEIVPNLTTLYFDETRTSYLWSDLQLKYIKVMAGEIYSNYFNEKNILDDVHLPVEMVKCYNIVAFYGPNGPTLIPPYNVAWIDVGTEAPKNKTALYRKDKTYYIYDPNANEFISLVPQIEIPVTEYAAYKYITDGGLLFTNINPKEDN